MSLKRKETDLSITECPSPNKKPCQEVNLADKYEAGKKLLETKILGDLEKKRNESFLIQAQIFKAEKTLHLLKYIIVKSFYNSRQVINNSDAASSSMQTRIHPAIKGIVGKRPTRVSATTEQQEPKVPEPVPGCSIEPDSVIGPEQSVEPSSVAAPEKSVEPGSVAALEKAVAPDSVAGPEKPVEPVTNKEKVKYRIIVGNISKWISPDSFSDKSTHKWMVYVRGSKTKPDITDAVAKIRLFLHPSYHPNDVIEITEPPFQLTRRGWGEFPVRAQIFFKNKANKAVDVIHNLKLDRSYSGHQTLGNETIVDLWIFSEKSNLTLENDKNECLRIKSTETPGITEQEQSEMNELNDMDSDCDFSIYQTPTDDKIRDVNLYYIEDHNYTSFDSIMTEKEYNDYQNNTIRLPYRIAGTVSEAVFFLLKHFPLVANVSKFLLCCAPQPYMAMSLKQFKSWSAPKRVCSEWFRARQIKGFLTRYTLTDVEPWTTQKILRFARVCHFTPYASLKFLKHEFDYESNRFRKPDIKPFQYQKMLTQHPCWENYSEAKEERNVVTQELIVNVESLDDKAERSKPNCRKSVILDEELVMPCKFIYETAKQIGVELRPQKLEYKPVNVTEQMLLRVIMCLAEELIRKGYAFMAIRKKGRISDAQITFDDIMKVLVQRPEFDIFLDTGLGRIEEEK